MANVPIWAPYPLPTHWSIGGIAYAGDDRTGARAVAVACSGPAPLSGAAEMVLVAEEPGVGLGAGCAGLGFADPGSEIGGTAAVHVTSNGHLTPLWTVFGPTECAAFVGESEGVWLWILLWPVSAGYILAEKIVLCDVRNEIPADLVALLSPSALSRLYPSG